MSESLKELEDRLVARMKACRDTAPRREGEDYVWDLPEGGTWRTRPFIDPRGKLETPVIPGWYVDEDKAVHANLPELCRLVELEHTPENERAITAMLYSAGMALGVRSIRIGRAP